MIKDGFVINLTKSQTRFMTEDVGDVKAIAYVTGFGGGKTFVLVSKMIALKLKYPKLDILYLMPIYSMFRDVLYVTLAEILEETNIAYKINKTIGEITFSVGPGRVILKSMDSPDTIVGMNVFAVFLDEFDTLPKDKAEAVWIKALARSRKGIQKKNGEELLFLENGRPDYHVNRLYVGTTPEGHRYTYQLFKKKKPENYVLIQASGYENVHLPADYYDNLKAIYPKNLIEAYINGEFVNMAQGSVYTGYSRIKCHTDAVYRAGEEIFISMDFNVMNMNGIVYVKRQSLKELGRAVKDYKYNNEPTLHAVAHLKDIKDTPEMCVVIKNKYPTSPVFIFPDSSGKNASSKGFTVSDISMLKQAGFHCKYPKKNPRIMDRVLAANSAFTTGLVSVNSDLCPDYCESLESQVFNKNTELPEKIAGSSIDDINDAGTYIIHYLYPINRKTFRSIQRRDGS